MKDILEQICNCKCDNCGGIYSKDLALCPHCKRVCDKCGKIYNPIENIACPYCKDKRDKLIVGLCIAFIIFAMILMTLF